MVRVDARNLAVKMYNGYLFIRQYLSMNIKAFLSELREIIVRDQLSVHIEIEFLNQIISDFLNQSNDCYLFGQFTIADAFYAPLCIRLKNYATSLSAWLSR